MALPLALTAAARSAASRVASPSGFLAAFKSGMTQGKTAVGAPVPAAIPAAIPAAASPASAAITAPLRAAAAPSKARSSSLGLGASLENLIKTTKDKTQQILSSSEEFSATNQNLVGRSGQSALAEKPGRSEEEILGAARPQDPARGGRIQAVAAAMLKEPRDLPAPLQINQPARKAPEAVRSARAAGRDSIFER